METINKETVLAALSGVKDPEIPSVSIVDLGMIERVEVEESHIHIQALPTFMGCPALDIIRNNMEEALKELAPAYEIQVDFVLHPPWTSGRISEEGRQRLKEFGIAPPPVFETELELWRVECPYCASPYTTVENLFGPTACRSILYCKSCKNPFEAMRPVSDLM